MACILKNIGNLIFPTNVNSIQLQQVRTKFVDWRMLKDYKRRKLVKQHGEERLRLNVMRKARVLPPELVSIVDQDIASFPRDACPVRLVPRCSLTSRPRGVVKHYRVSRICFRHLADQNLMSGIQRAFW
ncbi:UNVERIFIED_CONTAM: hypothetical protein PYX00_002315 [Menopon gallinae]|uniref:28S ribosomal protein S14, mitochondrial n=1 Tax=Menopon gallinae TaxID=328185 RepID=A0AAW2IGV1_9NEOP